LFAHGLQQVQRVEHHTHLSCAEDRCSRDIADPLQDRRMRFHDNLLFVEQRVNEQSDMILTNGENDA
jgi:hypothetical protein